MPVEGNSMENSKRPIPLTTIKGIRKRINTNPDFQRPAVGGTSQKQLLVDTVLRNYDVPKLYWRRTGTKPDTYDVVDGQQRLRALWDSFDEKFRLPKNADPIEGEEIAGCSYSDLPDELRGRFDVYPLDVVILEDTDEDEVREMFLRLQNGTSLKAQEKRNAFPGKMRELFTIWHSIRFSKGLDLQTQDLLMTTWPRSWFYLKSKVARPMSRTPILTECMK
jgi:Protein of unknown function DUF262